MTLRSGVFWPRPDVDSMLVRFFLREHPPVEAPEALLFRIIRASFQAPAAMNTLENARPAGRSSACAATPASTRGAAADPHARNARLAKRRAHGSTNL
jgi:16S rRNA (adenine1518-N6/adenine1519-N6)-dimethyltransferase